MSTEKSDKVEEKLVKQDTIMKDKKLIANVTINQGEGRRDSKLGVSQFHESIVDEKQRHIHFSQTDQERLECNRSLGNNNVTTQKYTWWNFIPKNLFLQITKTSNFYFLIISVMQTFEAISISGGKAVQAVPLVGVIIISMIKDAFEDYKRFISDESENKAQATILEVPLGGKSQKWIQQNWEDILCGQIIKVSNDEQIPADIVIIKTSDPKGQCFIETKNLDGETNLKIKQAQKDVLEKEALKDADHFYDVKGTIQSEQPNNQIYKFSGTVTIGPYNKNDDGKEIKEYNPLNAENLLLRGCMLRNTDFVYGIVVFTGHKTKIMQNSAKPKYKFSNLEKQTSTSIFLILCLQVCFALCSGLFGGSWITFYQDKTSYLGTTGISEEDKKGFAYYMFQTLGTWILIFTNFVPISMMVSLELVKFWQAMFMSEDVMMFDKEQDMQMRAQSSNLNEELGQVEYVFSDKTGTLTCNIMEFKKFTAGVGSYGLDEKPTDRPQLSNVCFKDDQMYNDLENSDQANHEALKKMLLHMGLCHTVIIDRSKGTYNAASPDELALINAAKQFGFVFKGEDENDHYWLDELDKSDLKTVEKSHKYELLNICEFDSTRKRQSVILKEVETGKIILMCKGADSIILDRMSEESKASEDYKQTQVSVDVWANQGLRTLFLAERVISDEDYNEWKLKIDKANLETFNRDEKVAAANELIEVELVLVGSTAIEDRLQDEVADTIKFMKNTGIKVWVLTGDKIGTAMNIGLSAGLLDNEMPKHIIRDFEEGDEFQIGELLDKYILDIAANIKNSPLQKQAVVIAGATLGVLAKNPEIMSKFSDAANAVDVVLACRVSPQQKADIVNMIRKRFPDKITLAIGDGANDVNMILQAHVGVGILGKEGQQAARAADYAIGQFKFLKPLMFIHGREAYRRNSFLVLYTFYKNVLYISTQFYFGFMSAFSGQPLYEPFIYQLYNVTMTSFPIMFFACFDFEFEKGVFMKNPLLFQIGLKNQCYSVRIFCQYVLYGLWHAIVLYFIGFQALLKPGQNMNDGKDMGLHVAGNHVYVVCILVANLIVAQRCNNFTGWGEMLLALMIFAAFFFMYVESALDTFAYFPQLYLQFGPMYSQDSIWMSMFIGVMQAWFLEFLVSRFYSLIYPYIDWKNKRLDFENYKELYNDGGQEEQKDKFERSSSPNSNNQVAPSN